MVGAERITATHLSRSCGVEFRLSAVLTLLLLFVSMSDMHFDDALDNDREGIG